MILLFVATQTGSAVQDLPDLHVQDSVSLDNISVAGILGWDGDYIQAQSITTSPLVLRGPDTGLVVDSYTTEYICKRLSKIVLSVLFSDSGATASIKPIYIDFNDVQVHGEPVTLTASSDMSDGLYIASVKLFDTIGAKSVKFKVLSVSSGTASAYVGGI